MTHGAPSTQQRGRRRSPDFELLGRAVTFATRAHAGQTRKGTEVPYVSHLLQVAGLVLEHASDRRDRDQLAVAALLHDAIEDVASLDAATLRREFGSVVAATVVGCTDASHAVKASGRVSWRERKRGFLEQIAGADEGVLLVVACDKLHNWESLAADLRDHGPGVIERFNAGAADQAWYARSVGSVLTQRLAHRPALVARLDRAVRELVRALGPRDRRRAVVTRSRRR